MQVTIRDGSGQTDTFYEIGLHSKLCLEIKDGSLSIEKTIMGLRIVVESKDSYTAKLKPAGAKQEILIVMGDEAIFFLSPGDMTTLSDNNGKVYEIIA